MWTKKKASDTTADETATKNNSYNSFLVVQAIFTVDGFDPKKHCWN